MIPPMQAYVQHLNMIHGDVEEVVINVEIDDKDLRGDRLCKCLVSLGIKLDFHACTLIAFMECVAEFS